MKWEEAKSILENNENPIKVDRVSFRYGGDNKIHAHTIVWGDEVFLESRKGAEDTFMWAVRRYTYSTPGYDNDIYLGYDYICKLRLAFEAVHEACKKLGVTL